MNKSIKRLIEEYIVSFNPAILANDTPKKKLSQDIINKALYTYNPETKEELIKIIQQRIKENIFGNENIYYPDLSDINVSNITDMSNLFKDALDQIKKPIILDLSGWDTSNVTNMYCMFYYCESLKELNISCWNTSRVTNMYCMFYACESLEELDLSNWVTSKVTDMSFMFSYCKLLKKLNLSGWDVSSVTNMDDMFTACESLTELDLSGWDTSKVANM